MLNIFSFLYDGIIEFLVSLLAIFFRSPLYFRSIPHIIGWEHLWPIHSSDKPQIHKFVKLKSVPKLCLLWSKNVLLLVLHIGLDSKLNSFCVTLNILCVIYSIPFVKWCSVLFELLFFSVCLLLFVSHNLLL